MQSSSSVAFVVHNLADTKRALEIAARAGADVTLLSPPSAASLLGPRVFNEMIATATSEIDCHAIDVSAVIDCGNTAGPALRAINEGCQHIYTQAPPNVIHKITEIAGAMGACATTGPIPAVDIASSKLNDVQLSAWINTHEDAAHV